ncbi:glycerate kinase [Leadbetterella byssophila DSM 17132]|uniref:Glycerate kinase n=1 Tax=Leadbetterella byssophila (strain DSM 17132 / JCM 16389 / KACC 11308 / NBRC 106382 / 4M15) TaxID=649349 RepID=E4RUL2_LEAB4|nr:glycerate kinase [Leadbetterella byssophila]ADQ18748.1 glycerate kinase [Leadbetterella byssophila DSM 17132]
MKFLFALDSFKGSLSSLQAGSLLASSFPAKDIEIISVADGGEGSLDMLPLPKIYFDTIDPLGRNIKSHFKVQNQTAYFELALSCGLNLLAPSERNPLKTSTYGLGLGIKFALSQGYKDFIIFVGGSATNDAGLGALSALGFEFYDKQGKLIKICGETLKDIHSYKAVELEINIQIATDVNNPLLGPNGATYTYAPQKGGTPEQLPLLEEGMKNLTDLFPNVKLPPGAGAAGGIGAGFNYFLNAKIGSASDLLLENLRSKLESADLIISGEGQIDLQTRHGKLIQKLMTIVPDKKFALVAGHISHPLENKQIIYQSSLTSSTISIPQAMAQAPQLMKEKGKELWDFVQKYYLQTEGNA